MTVTLEKRITDLEKRAGGPNLPKVKITFTGSGKDEELNRLYGRHVRTEDTVHLHFVFVKSDGNGGMLR
jgi:hypothetical protein